MWDKIKKILSPIAPVVGGMLGGPMGAIAGNAIKQALNLSDDATEDDVLYAVEHASAEQLLAIKQMDLQLEELQQKDRANARMREIELSKTGNKDSTPQYLAYILTGLVFVVFLFVLMHQIPSENRNLVYAMVSSLTTVWIAAMAYYHGSSSGSKQKDVLLERKLK